jgi:hypothetical protein
MSPAVAKSCAFALIPSIITLVLVQACGGSSDAVAQAPSAPVSDDDVVEGVWEGIVTVRDCTSGAPIFSLKTMNTFHRGGTITHTNNAAANTRAVGHGVWKRAAGSGAYTMSFRAYRYNPDGTIAGSHKLTRTITMAADNNNVTATFTGQVLDQSDNVVQPLCGTDTATRLVL